MLENFECRPAKNGWRWTSRYNNQWMVAPSEARRIHQTLAVRFGSAPWLLLCATAWKGPERDHNVAARVLSPVAPPSDHFTHSLGNANQRGAERTPGRKHRRCRLRRIHRPDQDRHSGLV